MSLLAYPVVAMVGALVGTLAHEATHAAVAVVVGSVERVGWQDGLGGGPFVDFRARSRWRSEAVRKAPLVVGLAALVALVATYRGPTLAWVGAAGATLGLLRASPEDLCESRAQQSP